MRTILQTYRIAPCAFFKLLFQDLYYASFAYNTFSIIGVNIDDTIISKITDVKYTGVKSPADNPFCDTISATSPLVIMPTPILSAVSYTHLTLPTKLEV